MRQFLTLRECLGRIKPHRDYYNHLVSIINGMSSATDKALSNLAVAFVSRAGVVGVNDYLVQAQVSPNNTIKVGTGRAYVETSDGTMFYATLLDATQNVTITSNSSGSAKVDSIVLYIDLSASPDSTASNVAKFADVRGTGGVAPTNSEILTAIGSLNPYIILANIAVANGFTSISSGNITDERVTTTLLGTSPDGWLAAAGTWTYSSTDGHTFVLTVPSDATLTYTPGMRVKFTNNSTTFYGIVTAVSSTTLTLYGGTNYSVANSAISNIYYSPSKTPFGFNTDPTIWTDVLRDTSDHNSSPSASTWTNFGSLSLAIPIGIWRVFYQVILQANTTTQPVIQATLSTANNSASDIDFISAFSASASSALNFTASREKVLVLASKTTYYLNGQYSGTVSLLGFYGSSFAPTIIKAVCAYL